jgi:GntR family transcriptional regulator
MQKPKPGALPLYLQIAETLTIEIRSGKRPVGARLPPERQLAAEMQVTVTTLRKALKILDERGLLDRRQGSGNYVRDGRHDLGTYAFFRLELLEGGGLPTADLLLLERVVKPGWLRDFASPSRDAWRLRRLRYLDDLPVAIEEIWLDGRFEGSLTPETTSHALYRTYRDRLGLVIERTEDRIALGPAPAWTPPSLRPSDTRPFGLVRRRAYDGYGALAEVSTTWFDPARAVYVSRTP